MTLPTETRKIRSPMNPWWLTWIGLLAWIGTATLAVRLVWEQTILSWELGPQMIGFSLIHSDYTPLILSPLILMVWLVTSLCITLVAVRRKEKISLKRWGTLCLTILILTVLFLPYSFWLRLFADRISSGPYAADFLCNSAATGDLSTVEELLSHGVLINSIDPQDGSTALHAASVGGHMNIVEYLVSKGANINAVNRFGDSPLENAISMGSNEVARFLSDRGALQIRGDKAHRDSVISQIVREDIRKEGTSK